MVSFVVPVGVTSLLAEGWGNGVTPPDNGGTPFAISGGGGGAYGRKVFPVTPGETLDIVQEASGWRIRNFASTQLFFVHDAGFPGSTEVPGFAAACDADTAYDGGYGQTTVGFFNETGGGGGSGATRNGPGNSAVGQPGAPSPSGNGGGGNGGPAGGAFDPSRIGGDASGAPGSGGGGVGGGPGGISGTFASGNRTGGGIVIYNNTSGAGYPGVVTVPNTLFSDGNIEPVPASPKTRKSALMM